MAILTSVLGSLKTIWQHTSLSSAGHWDILYICQKDAFSILDVRMAKRTDRGINWSAIRSRDKAVWFRELVPIVKIIIISRRDKFSKWFVGYLSICSSVSEDKDFFNSSRRTLPVSPQHWVKQSAFDFALRFVLFNGVLWLALATPRIAKKLLIRKKLTRITVFYYLAVSRGRGHSASQTDWSWFWKCPLIYAAREILCDTRSYNVSDSWKIPPASVSVSKSFSVVAFQVSPSIDDGSIKARDWTYKYASEMWHWQ